jgi:transmembrane sensor
MDKMNERLERLGRAVADVSDQARDPETLHAARSRFLASAASKRPRFQRAAVGFALAAACAAAIGFYVRTRPADVSFAVGIPPAPGVVGNWISASDAATELRFSEGSALALAPGARIRVTETNPRGAAVLIENGNLHAKVTRASSDTRWAFRAGPFDVKVTGTELDASWDPTTETFEVAVIEGSVFATGPMLRDGRALVAGEILRVSIRENKLEIRISGQTEKAPIKTNSVPTNAVEATAPVAPPPAASAETNTSPPAVPGVSARVVAPTAASSEPDWKALAASGKHKHALAAAEKLGFSQEVARASLSELFVLADAARFGGSPARARDALLAARTRFGSRGRTAFLIGKIAADQQGSAGEAAVWFETYLQEEPGGPLAEQALGRLLEIRRRGDGATARAVAKRYLARYPQGAYAALARSVLEL